MITRRQFVGMSAAGIVASNVGKVCSSTSKSEVYVGKGKAAEIIPSLIEKMGGIGRFVPEGSRVVVKPNMSFANPPEWATTTSPDAVQTVCKLCLKAGAKRVIVCDNTLREPDLCKRKTGIGDALKDLKGVVIYTPRDATMFEERTEAKARALPRTAIVREVLRADVLISLPTAKSHSAAGVSLGIKGLMGLIYDRGAFHREVDIHVAIAEQLYYIKPTLTIIDASRALLDNGPAGPGKVVELNTFVAGVDPVAVDAYAVTLAPWYGRSFEGRQVAHIKHAAALGFGTAESSEINVVNV